MAFDALLAARLNDLFPPDAGFVAKKMFGGLGILLNGNMCVGVWKNDLILRLGVDEAARVIHSQEAREFDVTGRPMKGWVMVEADGLGDDDLFRWCEKAVRFVSTLPAKPND